MRAAGGEGLERIDRRLHFVRHDREAPRQVRPTRAGSMHDVPKDRSKPVRQDLSIS